MFEFVSFKFLSNFIEKKYINDYNNANANEIDFFSTIVYLNCHFFITLFFLWHSQMWQQVKGENPSLSICEIGSAIGRLWRELSDDEKQKHNEGFTLDKVSRCHSSFYTRIF